MALRGIESVEVSAKLGRLLPGLGQELASVLGHGFVETIDLLERTRPKCQIELQLDPLWPAQHLPDLIALSLAVAHQGLVQFAKSGLVSGSAFNRRMNA